MPIRSPIDLQIPEVPAGVPDDFVPIFQGIYNALRNLQMAVGDASGINYLDPVYVASVSPTYSQSIQSQNIQFIYVVAKGAIAQGQFTGLVLDTGILKATLASAAAGVGQVRGWGWASQAIADGQKGIINLLSGYNPNFAGLSPATVYYLSDSSPGGISSAKPVGAGKIVQEVGVALSATELLVNLNTPITL